MFREYGCPGPSSATLRVQLPYSVASSLRFVTLSRTIWFPLSLLRAAIISLFSTMAKAEAWLGQALGLDFEGLNTDAFVQRAASINFEREDNDKFSNNTLYSFAMRVGRH